MNHGSQFADGQSLQWGHNELKQSILKELNPEYSLEGLMLKLQSFSYLMQRANLLEKILMLGKIEGRRRRGWQRTRQLDGIIDSTDPSLSKLWEIMKTGKPGVLQSMEWKRVRQNWATEQQQMWDLVPWPGTEPWPLALGAQSLSHWITSEVPAFPINWCWELQAWS